METNYEELQKENVKLREQIGNLGYFLNADKDEIDELWNLIGELIDVEINQERFCNI